ncbi:terminase [Thermomonas brevis]
MSLVEDICARLAEGEPLAQICRDDGMPGITTLWRWEREHEGVAETIACAREAGHEVIAARTRGTARGKVGQDGDSSGDVQRDKLIIETDLKLLAKWNPRKWGDKLQHADADGEKLAPATIVIAPVLPNDNASG